jgi:hypothetical protein
MKYCARWSENSVKGWCELDGLVVSKGNEVVVLRRGQDHRMLIDTSVKRPMRSCLYEKNIIDV